MKTVKITPSGEWSTCPSPMAAIRNNPDLLEAFATELAEVVKRESLSASIGTKTSMSWVARPYV